MQLVQIEGDRRTLRGQNTNIDNNAPRTFEQTLENNPCRLMRGSDKLICAGIYKFPMTSDSKYAYEQELPWPNGLGKSDGNCAVKGEEKITVPAGTFDTVKIECEGFWRQVFEGTWNGRWTETNWYAPKVNRSVKWIYKSRKPNGSLNDQTQTELTEFIPKQ